MTVHVEQKDGCEHCLHYVSVELDHGEHRWRIYCGLGNFNIFRSSFKPELTSHGKLRYVREDIGDLEFARPNRCPLLKQHKK